MAQGDTCCIKYNQGAYLAPVTLPDTQDPAFLQLGQEKGFLISDQTFDGQRKRIPFKASLIINSGFERISRFYVLLRSVSSDYYYYHSTITRQLSARESPFAEPVIIYNNVENGLGNFAAYSTATDSVTFSR